MKNIKLLQIGFNEITAVLSLITLIFAAFYPFDHFIFISLAVLFLGFAISSAVHSSEIIALRVGPSLGTIILALAVTIIEVALILSLMKNKGPDADKIARDTVFATIMIVTNGIIGICIILGSLRYKELAFQKSGTSAFLAVIAVLASLTMVLPNFTISAEGPIYSNGQLIFISVASLVLYGALVLTQTKTNKNFFEPHLIDEQQSKKSSPEIPTLTKTVISFFSLSIALIAVVGLAKILSPTLGSVISNLGAPKAVVGIVIALLVLAPETFAAINSARTNQLQTSLNIALGSGAASIALTIPVVSLYSIFSSEPLTLGLSAKNTVLLILTLIAGGFTFGTGRSTILHGIVHLVLLATYIALTFMP